MSDTRPLAQTAAPDTPRVVRLQLWLPLGMVLTALAILCVLLVVDGGRYIASLQQFADRTAHEELLRTRRSLEAALRRTDGSSLDGLVTGLGLDRAVRHAALVDDAGAILAATRLAWKGGAAPQLIPDYPQQAARQVLQTQREALELSIAGQRLTALAPVTLGLRPGELRATRHGLLLIEYDLSPLARQALGHLLQQALVFGSVLLLGALIAVLLARRLILRPLQVLQQGLARIGAGDFTHVPRLRGRGELRELADAMARMAAELQARSAALQDSEARYRQLSDAAFEGIVLHEDGVIVDGNAAAERLMGVPPGSLMGRDLFSFVAAHDMPIMRQRAQQGEEGVWSVDLLDHTGSIIAAECSVRQRSVGGRTLRVVAVRDIRERLAAQAEIRQLSHVDALTGLPNRHALLQQLAEEVARDGLPGRRAALAVLNLDAFKSVNDSLGMAAGDLVLRTIARRLSAALVPGQAVARINADSFALLISGLQGSLEQASATAARAVEGLLAQVAQPLHLPEHEQVLHLSAAAGVVMMPNDSREPPELLREAETAMHQAKQAGTRVQFFAHALQQAASARLLLRNDLRQALDGHGQLLLHYQPQVDRHGQILGVEALVRWQHPRRGLIPPGEFIAEAEASGLIVPLGQWVLEEAVSCLRRWRSRADELPWARQLSMGVNVSPRQFRDNDFVARVQDVLACVGVDALSLELELTENVVADDLQATLEKMAELRRHGVRFALDDFGTGYSSLSYLKHLPINTLKIDRSFVMDIGAPVQDGGSGGKSPSVLIDAIVAMAHQLDLCVLAEGVETPSQLARLVATGCDVFQGYYFSRPLPEDALVAWAQAQAGKASAQVQAVVTGP
ncbi:hypothetical protein GCM10027019_11650 [Melaminivora jejuensis]|uniref:putative bifunctional diguanylate cyclase/phosphodiesterase n=1 Tax=Melaminivora jejuensis TaxID=1267217 RepID=UPI001E61DA64|nr:EAL domain-containing protein [Melaminivora jejuensis]UHJ65091.1 EAL domain-containing protein [Melaminivora jejuensis]